MKGRKAAPRRVASSDEADTSLEADGIPARRGEPAGGGRGGGRTHVMVLVQSWWALARRPGRAVLTAIGVALGVAVFLTTIGLASSMNSVVNATFDQTMATRIQISGSSALDTAPVITDTFDKDVRQLKGVVAGGQKWSARSDTPITRLAADTDYSSSATLMAVSPGAFAAAEATVSSGRFYDDAMIATGQPVAVLGAAIAKDLHITEVTPGLAVTVAGVPVTVVGILKSYGSEPDLGLSVSVPPQVAESMNASQVIPARGAIVRTKLGAADQVAIALPYVVDPTDPSAVNIQLPPSLDKLRSDVQSSLNGMAIGAALLSLFIGGIGIMNAMLVSVAQRSSEIGLRRAIGARSRHIVEQIVTEGALLGALGGIIGAITACAVLIGICLVNGWTPVLEHSYIYAAPLAGLAIGAIAGIYPATRAAHIAPAQTLRTQ